MSTSFNLHLLRTINNFCVSLATPLKICSFIFYKEQVKEVLNFRLQAFINLLNLEVVFAVEKRFPITSDLK